MQESQSFNWLDNFRLIREQERNMSSRDFLRVGREAQCNCPICGNKDKACMVSQNGEIVICMKVPSEKPVTGGLGGWAHRIGENHSTDHQDAIEAYLKAKREHKSQQATAMASPEVLNEFYTSLLKRFPLSSNDDNYLARRGIQDRSDYGTLPKPPHYNRHTLPKVPPVGIPGVFHSWDGTRAYLNAYDFGIYCLIRDYKGRAVGVEIRPSDECRELHPGRPKYVSLGTGEIKLRDGKTIPRHNGYKADVKQYGVIRASKPNDTLVVTEGFFKGRIGAEILGLDHIPLRGVGLWHQLVEDLLLYFPEKKHVILAFDIDRYSNPNVNKAHDDLLKALIALVDVKVSVYIWDTAHEVDEQGKAHYLYKGLDDILTEKGSEALKLVTHHTPSDLYTNISVREPMKKLYRELLMETDSCRHVTVQATPGAGKTHGLIELYNEIETEPDGDLAVAHRQERTALLTDNKKLMTEAGEKFLNAPFELHGRSRDEMSPGYCSNMDEVEELGRKGQSIVEGACKGCPMFEHRSCPYWINTDRALKTERMIITTKAAVANKGNRLDAFQRIIVDESLEPLLIASKELTLDDIEAHIKVLQEHQSYADEKYGKSFQIQKSIMILELFKTMIETCDMDPYADPVQIEIPNEFKGIYDKHEKQEIQEQMDDGSYKATYLKAFISDLDTAVVFSHQGKIVMEIPQYEVIERLKERMLICLDATIPNWIVKVMGKQMEVKQFRVKEHAHIVQTMNIRGSKRQLRDDATSDRMLDTIKHIATMDPDARTGVMTTKEFSEKIEAHSKIHGYSIEIGYINRDHKGTNRFEGIKNYILAGDYCRNLGAMKMRQLTLKAMGVDISLEDLVNDDALEAFAQSMGRPRSTQREGDPVNIFLLTNRDFSSIYPNIIKVKSLESLRGVAERDQQAGNQKRAEDAESKVRDYLLNRISQGFAIHELTIKRVMEEAWVSRDVARRVMTELYYQQLCDSIQQGAELDEDKLRQMAAELRKPTIKESCELQLNVTSRLRASDQDLRLTLCTATMLCQQEPGFFEWLTDHLPVGKNSLLWLGAINAIQASAENDMMFSTMKEFGEAFGSTRQKASEVLSWMSDKLGLYRQVQDRFSTDTPPPVEEWSKELLHGDLELVAWSEDLMDVWKNEGLDEADTALICDAIDTAMKLTPNGDEVRLWSEQTFETFDIIEYFAVKWGFSERVTATAANLVNARIVGSHELGELNHPIYWIESLCGSLKWLTDDSRMAYSCLKSIYSFWRMKNA